MSKETQDILEFGPFRVNRGEAVLTRDGAPVSLSPKVFEMLAYLASNPGRLIEKEELLRALWPDSFVEEANLTVNIATLRRALGTQPGGESWIETVPKRGYRFVGTVTIARPAVLEIPVPAVEKPTLPRRRIAPIAGIALVAILLLPGVYLAWSSYVGRTRTGPDGRLSLAVLPFEEIGNSSRADERAGLGMTDSLITKLGTLPQLTVRTFAAVRKYEGASYDPLEAGRTLRVHTVLTGSIQRLDKRIRVSVRLLRVEDGQSLWAEKFDEFVTNLFAVQDTISEKLAKVLSLRLTSEEQERMFRRYTESTEAHRFYELGRLERQHRIADARAYFERSIAQDPRFALPYVELSDIFLGVSGNGLADFQKYAPLARQNLANALRLAPDLAEVRAAAAGVKRFIDRDFAGARKELDAGLKLNPGSARVHDANATLLAVLGDRTAALAEARKAMSLDPFNSQTADNLAWILHCNHEDQAAVAWLDEFRERDPAPRVDWNRYYVYLGLRRYTEAIAIMENARQVRGSQSRPVNVVLAHGYALAGRTKDAQEILAALPPDWGFYQRAVVEIALGRLDAALANLDRAVDERSVWIEWIKVDPDLDSVRGDPRFAKVVARMGLEP